MKAKIDHKSGELTPIDVDTNCTLIKDADVKSMTELALNKILVHIYPKDLLFIQNW